METSASFEARSAPLPYPTTGIAGARLVALPCGHEIPQELPEQTAALLEAFLSGVSHAVLAETVAA